MLCRAIPSPFDLVSRHIVRQSIFAVGLMLLFSLFAPQSAFAEGNCPPGMYPVGGQGVQGCAPMGEPTDSHRDYKEMVRKEQEEHDRAVDRLYKKMLPKKVVEVDSYSALVWHPAANDYWAIWNSNTSEAFAKERALDYCTKAMGSGCTVAVSGKSLSMAIAMVDGMISEVSWDLDFNTALVAVMKQCETKWGADRCLLFKGMKATKVANMHVDFLDGHVPNAEQAIRYKKTTKTLKRSVEPAANYINKGNMEKEFKNFIVKWDQKIRQTAPKTQEDMEAERAARVR